MAFKKTPRSTGLLEDPEALFRDLRNRSVQGLLAHQADMLRAYQQSAIEASDVAMQLPTGSGKTLVGLLLGEWRRRRFNERVAYLCPTKQLVNQVVEQGRSYGIRAAALIGKQAEYPQQDKSDYLNGEVVAVSTYSALFNTNPFLDNASVLILDDAHAAENYVADHWSLLIKRSDHKSVFDALTGFLKPYIAATDYIRLVSASPRAWDHQWVEKVPTPALAKDLPKLVALLDEQVTGTRLRFPWSVVRDYLHACHLYISVASILIRPIIAPTSTHAAFTGPRQRVYMSATLGEGGELERIWGRAPIVRLPVPPGWDHQGVGRRFFMFPERTLNDKDCANLLAAMIKATPRALVLAPDSETASEFETTLQASTGYELFHAAELEASKAPFTAANGAIAVLANRYDGIDLAGDDCRLLIACGLPQATNLQERFVMSRMAAGVLLKDRILTRITQAIGRCTRSATDYSAVVVLGDELSKFLMLRENRALLHPEIQGELEFGLEQSRNIEVDDFTENFLAFLARGDDWTEAESEILAYRNAAKRAALPAIKKLSDAARHEILYQGHMWRREFESALNDAKNVLAILSGDDVKGYRSLWSYLAGCAAWHAFASGATAMEAVAREHFRTAAITTAAVRWLTDLARVTVNQSVTPVDDQHLLAIVIRLEEQFGALGTVNSRRFESRVKEILDGLASNEAKKFEPAHEALGLLLGFDAHHDSGSATPDTWWIVDGSLVLVFEDHTNVTLHDGNAPPLGANKVRQGASHPNWIRANVADGDKAEIVPVMVTPCQTLEDGTAPHAGDLCHWQMDDFRAWASNAVAIIRELWTAFPGAGDLAWRSTAMTSLRNAALDPASVIKALRERPLSNLPNLVSERK